MKHHTLEDYSFGRVTVDGEGYTKDLIVHDGGVISNWWRKQGHSLVPEDLDAVMTTKPRVLIVGCGASAQLVVPRATLDWLREQGIEVVPLPTGEACRRYNDIASQGDVVAALHLTC
jgi:hypothetical protein